jgi:hypothetical protein
MDFHNPEVIEAAVNYQRAVFDELLSWPSQEAAVKARRAAGRAAREAGIHDDELTALRVAGCLPGPKWAGRFNTRGEYFGERFAPMRCKSELSEERAMKIDDIAEGRTYEGRLPAGAVRHVVRVFQNSALETMVTYESRTRREGLTRKMCSLRSFSRWALRDVTNAGVIARQP